MTVLMYYLSDSMPMDDDSLGVEFVGEADDDGVAGASPDGGARELAVDAHHHVLLAVRCSEDVLNIEVVVSNSVPTESYPGQNR